MAKETMEASEKERMKSSDDADMADAPHKEAKKEADTECPDCHKPTSECECVSKDQFGGKDPVENAGTGNSDGHTTSPNAGVPSTQNVVANNSGIVSARGASSGSSMGQSPSDVHYSGKSVNPDLMKSPLFVELSKKLVGMQEAIEKKFDAVQKSFNDRIESMKKELNATEAAFKKFYEQPFYKSESADAGAEGVTHKSIADQISEGKVRFTSA